MSLFAGVALARRIEHAERGLVEDAVDAVGRARGSAAAWREPLAGGVAGFAGADSPLTKVAGLGFDGAPDDAELERVEARFAAAGAAVQVELATLAEHGIAERLTRRGYALVGFEDVLGRVLPAPPGPGARDGVTVERSGADELEAWLDVLVSAFLAPDVQGVASHESFPRAAMERAIRDFAGSTAVVHYLARQGGALAGGASVRLAGGVAQLCGAGTLPAHRRRGVQGALLARRLADAAAAGCDLAVLTTLPGSKSQENALRQGFERLYTRAILRRGG